MHCSTEETHNSIILAPTTEKDGVTARTWLHSRLPGVIPKASRATGIMVLLFACFVPSGWTCDMLAMQSFLPALPVLVAHHSAWSGCFFKAGRTHPWTCPGAISHLQCDRPIVLISLVRLAALNVLAASSSNYTTRSFPGSVGLLAYSTIAS